jgi:hypothetical protein
MHVDREIKMMKTPVTRSITPSVQTPNSMFETLAKVERQIKRSHKKREMSERMDGYSFQFGSVKTPMAVRASMAMTHRSALTNRTSNLRNKANPYSNFVDVKRRLDAKSAWNDKMLREQYQALS